MADVTPPPATPTTPPADEPLLVHSVSWSGGEPHLLVSNPLADGRRSLPLVGQRLAFTVDAGGRYCTGVFVASSPDDGRHHPCDGARLATGGGQCERCAARDESRFMHHAHRDGYVPESLDRYLAQPHWLYLATFADGVHKIGTASDPRKRVRLDEQGAVRATYVAHARDGRAVRVLEDAVTQRLGVAQTRHKASKAAALARSLASATLDAAHASRVADVETFLRAQGLPDAELPHEAWRPPALHDAFFSRGGVHPPYPHALDTGEHCLTPHAMVGGIALVAVNAEPSSPATPKAISEAPPTGPGHTAEDDLMLVDLDRLRGRRITFGDVRSPSTTAQHSLF